MVDPKDRGPVFDGLKLGRAATGALIDAGYRPSLTCPQISTTSSPCTTSDPRPCVYFGSAGRTER